MTALLAVALLAMPASAAVDGDEPAAVVLAAASGEEPAGPDPIDREAEDNPARVLGGYEDRDTPFTWGAAWILTFAGVMGLAMFVGLYHFLVRRPAQRADS
ncbi:MAG: hypothetical protein WED12_05425 [Chloroflexota bacterium]